METPNIEPTFKRGGSAFNGNRRLGTRPIPNLFNGQPTKVVSLSQFCQQNFISRYQGYRAIELKLLIAFKMFGRWWVRSNPDCYQDLLDYLGLEELLFDAE